MGDDGTGRPLRVGRSTPDVVRIGDVVCRPSGPNTPFGHAVLRHLEAVGYEGAPRAIGYDAHGRQLLSFIPGRVKLRAALSDEQIVAAARLVRGFHDATAGTTLAAPHDVVCHTDLGPHNTLFRKNVPVALIDWDDARPGTRLDDLAPAVWCYCRVEAAGGPIRDQARRIAVFCDAYGLDDRRVVIDELRAQHERALTNDIRENRGRAAALFRRWANWLCANADALLRP